MKALLIAVPFGVVAFAGVFYVMSTPSEPKLDGVPLVTELPAATEPKAEEETEGPVMPRETKDAKAKPAPDPYRRPPHWDAATKEKAQERPQTHYTFVANSRGPIPDRIILHKTTIGDVTIVLTDNDGDGQLYIRRGSYSHEQQQHPWEVRVVQGVLTVYWDGQDIPYRR